MPGDSDAGVRGTLGKPPPPRGGRDSDAADGGDSDADDAGGPRSPAAVPARRGSRCGPGQSQIDRWGSPPVLAGVANAGVNPGADPSSEPPRDGAGSSGDAGGDAAGAAAGARAASPA
ncbi:MAG TPA: hypothetical protein VK601_00470 [Kofleriaceae bacterium]|nr:hypothetical protein [Kofleriaceae bacterium]